MVSAVSLGIEWCSHSTLYRDDMDQKKYLSTLQTILVTNTRSYTDRQSMAADLAVKLAKNGKKVALLDADFRRPLIHNLFELPNELGFSDILINHRSPLSVMHKNQVDHLSILTSGTQPGLYLDLFNSAKMDLSMKILKESYDKIIIHGPPFFFSETVNLASRADAVIILIHPGYNKTESSRSIINKFQQTNAQIIGIVMRDQPRHQANQSMFIDQLLSFDKRAKTITEQI